MSDGHAWDEGTSMASTMANKAVYKASFSDATSGIAEQNADESFSRPHEDAMTPTSREAKHKKRAVNFLVIVLHGIGANPEALEKNKQDFVSSLKAAPLLLQQLQLFQKILPSTGESMPATSFYLSDPRQILNNALSDFICYLTPPYGDTIIANAAQQLNQAIASLQKVPKYEKAKIILVGHSLGGIILHELLTNQMFRPVNKQPRNTKQTDAEQPGNLENADLCSEVVNEEHRTLSRLEFPVYSVFFFGCPLAAFYVLHQTKYPKLLLPQGTRVYNVYHPHDPVAFRLEPLYYTVVEPLPPAVILPYWKNNGPRDYIRWTRDANNIRRVVADYVRGVTATASHRIRQMLGQRTTTVDAQSGSMNVVASTTLIDNQHNVKFLDEAAPSQQSPVTIQLEYGTPNAAQHQPSMMREAPVVSTSPQSTLNIESVTMNTAVPGSASVTVQRRRSTGKPPSSPPLLSPVPAPETSDGSGGKPGTLTTTQRSVYLKVSAHQRYGTHDRKPHVSLSSATAVAETPKRRFGRRKDAQPSRGETQRHSEANTTETEVPYRQAATLARLLRALDLDINQQDVREAVYTVLNGSSGAPLAQLETPAREEITEYVPFTRNDKVDIFSECELEGGLELPVRIDFELQELTAEHYVVSLGNLQSHFNYWTSKDSALFILKQITNLHPRVCYPDFLKLLEVTEKRKVDIEEGKARSDSVSKPSNKSTEEEQEQLDSRMTSRIHKRQQVSKKKPGYMPPRNKKDDRSSESPLSRRRWSSKYGKSPDTAFEKTSLPSADGGSDYDFADEIDTASLTPSTTTEPRRLLTLHHVSKPNSATRREPKQSGDVAGRLFFG